ncbi:MAG: hypothetical protein Udaeo2_33490 [Candidatus Udaeobacter sp.]|nr:MAG: hypothetical protein Udaeo2_33490 [Candidatus Udaeobacter sp.]
MLVPVIGLVQVGEQGHADRYTYLPSIGLFLIAVWAAGDVVAVDQAIMAWCSYRRHRSGRCCPGCTAFTQTSLAKQRDALSHASPSPPTTMLPTIISATLVDRGELDKAMSHYEAALKIRSGKLDPHYNLATAF